MKVGIEDLNKYVVIMDNLANHYSTSFTSPLVCASAGELIEAIETAGNIMNSFANLIEKQELHF